jgi:peptidoglycan/xylan/chitin deacetylase (PgdA/CDA1 family)
MKTRWLAMMVLGLVACTSASPDADGDADEGVETAADLTGTATRPRGYYPSDALPAKTAFLTFDDGPGAWTSTVLDTLKQEDVKATFFVCSHANDKYKPATKRGFAAYTTELFRMVDEGHVLGNHTVHHSNLGQAHTEAEVGKELDDNELELAHAFIGAGRRPIELKMLRAPFGSPFLNGGSSVAAPAFEKRGFSVLWNVDSGDSASWVAGDWLEPSHYTASLYYNPDTNAYRARVQSIESKVLGAADGKGIVVLMHDIHATTRDALPGIIHGLKERGYVFSTADKLQP